MTDNNSRIVYGVHTISNIIESDKAKVKKIFFRKGELNKNLTNLHKKALNAGLYIEEVETDQLTLLCESKRHQGIACEIVDSNLSAFNLDNFLNLNNNPFILMLDQIKDPNNLGACIRSANAAGCDLIIKRKSNSSPISPAVHKASCGGTTGISIYETNDLNGIIKKLKSKNVYIIGTDHKAQVNYSELRKTNQTGVCIIMGSEDVGMSRALKTKCDIMCSIPIKGTVDCLNISVACGIMLYEVAKNR